MGLINRFIKPITESLFRGFYNTDVTYGNQYPTFSTKPGTFDNPLYSAYSKFMRLEQNRKQSYRDYERMDNDVVAAALDLIADDSTQLDLESANPFQIICDDPKIKKTLEKLYFDTLSIEEHLWDIVRMFNKYGDFFVRVYGDKQNGITNINYSYHPGRFVKVVDKGLIRGFVLDEHINLSPWEAVHFKLPGSMARQSMDEVSNNMSNTDEDVDAADYGTSSLYRSRKVWRQVSLLEDSILLSRLTRSVRRTIFQINTDGLNELMAQETVDNFTELLKRQRAYSPSSMDSMSSAVLTSQDEDIILPVNGAKGVLNVTPIGDGNGDVSDTADLDYMSNKLFGSLKVPKAFLGFEDALNGRNTLRMLDVRYARTIKVSQRALCLGLERLGYIHLALLTKDPLAVKFSIKLPYISTIEEVERMEVYGLKVQALSTLVDLISRIDQDFTTVQKVAFLKHIMKTELKWDDATISKLIDEETFKAKLSDKNATFTD